MAELWVVATPIGNLGDLSPRMARALTECDLIAAEDTRVTQKLLSHLGIGKPLTSLHRHNERKKAPELIERMIREDLKIALTTDAGTPGISDPGVELVRLAHEAGISVTPIPGPTALASALSASGFDAREFAFYGFLPREKKPLREKLQSMRRRGDAVVVAYESPHRVLELVEQIEAELPGCEVCVCCDLTKKFEKIERGEVSEVVARMRGNPNLNKGEYAVVIDCSMLPPLPIEKPGLSAELAVLSHMMRGGGLDEAAEAAQAEGFARNEIYKARLAIKKRFGARENG